MKYIPYVNVLQGTNSVPEFSHGNILPVTAVPFGMNGFALETRGRTHSLFFNPSDVQTTGIRLTHMPSPWINDYGTFSFSVASGDENGARFGGHASSAYTLARTTYTPAQIDVEMMVYRASMHLVPTVRGAIVNLRWEKKDETPRFLLTTPNFPAKIGLLPEKRMLVGYTASHTWDVPENFRMYFAMTFDRDFDLSKTRFCGRKDKQEFVSPDGTTCLEAPRAMMNLAFVPGEGDVVCRMATSFLSEEQAILNLNREVAGKDLDALLHDAEETWEAHLSKIEIDADEQTMRTFYSCLYRMMLFPRVFSEYGQDGKQIHYSPDTGRICDGPMYTDNGFWDTYKTVYPLYSLILSDRYRDMCRGFCNFYKEAGWLPRWMSPGAVNCMPGTAIDAVFGDAAIKGVVTDRNDLNLMLEAAMQHVENVSPKEQYGRDGIEGFNTLGYVTSDHKESVNKTQDYAYGNYCVAQIARALGKEQLAKDLEASSLKYRNLWDNEVGFMRARDKDGKKREGWNCFQWGGDYTEGSSWQNSFAMFHDFRGLAKVMGGRDKLEKKLDDLFSTKPCYDVWGYGFEIHEMVEMAAVDFGQFALSNQPSFHLPYIYSVIGRPEKAAYWVRRAAKELFSDGPNGYPGDEDNGSMAGWYVFSSLGFYPVCPGAAEYVVGSPTVRGAVIHTDGGRDLVIRTENQGERNYYVSSMTLNGEKLHRTYLSQKDLKNGGTLTFALSSDPVGGEYEEAELPFSLDH